jgi:stage II sporulation protein E
MRFHVSDIAAMMIVLASAYMGGGGMGAVMGTTVAAVLGGLTGDLVVKVALFSVAGLLSGTMRRWGKWSTVLGMFLGLALVISYERQWNLWSPWNSWALGTLSFLLIPKQSLSKVFAYFPSRSGANSLSEEQRRLRELFLVRLNDLAGIFGELAKSFKEENPAKQ